MFGFPQIFFSLGNLHHQMGDHMDREGHLFINPATYAHPGYLGKINLP